MEKKYYWIFGIVVLVLIIGLVYLNKETKISGEGGEPSPDLNVELNIDGEPILNNIVDISLSMESKVDFSRNNIIAKINLPTDFQLVEGNLEWNGSLSKDEVKIISAKIKPIKTGYFIINSEIIIDQLEGFTNKLYLEVDEDLGVVSKQPLINETTGEYLPQLGREAPN